METLTPACEARSSFRDPAGRTIRVAGRVFRVVTPQGWETLSAFLNTRFARGRIERGDLVASWAKGEDELARAIGEGFPESVVLEHPPVSFPSFPHEWPPRMLRAAGLLTLELAEGSLAEGFGLKDATPHNVLFEGFRPVFVDLLSFERRDPANATWLAYAQFVRTFLLPLAAHCRLGLPLGPLLLAARDGLEPEQVRRWAGAWQRLTPPILNLATIPVWLERHMNPDHPKLYRERSLGSPARARFIYLHLLRRARRTLTRLVPRKCCASPWLDYVSRTDNYSEEDRQVKESFVRGALRDFPASNVLDLGCNSGRFSALAARCGAQVVAVDSDAAVVDRTWEAARESHLDILPLVVDIARPTPAAGWRNQECASFLERARGRFDLVLMLALVHHLLVNERVPLAELTSLAAELTTDLFLVEYVDPSDPMFQRLARGRLYLHEDLSEETFEQALASRFDFVRRRRLAGGRRSLSLWRKRT